MKLLRLLLIAIPFALLWLVGGLADMIAEVFDGVGILAQRAAAWLEEQR